MKKPAPHLIAEVPRKRAKIELTIGIDLGDVWSHYCTLNQEGEVVDRGRFRTTAKAIEKWFAHVPHARVAMEAGVRFFVAGLGDATALRIISVLATIIWIVSLSPPDYGEPLP